MEEWTIHATAAFGLEAVVKAECRELGFDQPRIEAGHVLYQGGRRELALSNLALGAADRVLIELGRFEVFSFEELFEKTRALPWEDWLPRHAAFPIVSAKTIKSTLHSPSDVQSIVKKAVVQALQRAYPLSRFPEDGPLFPIEVTIRDNLCLICLDSSGEGLFKRGYRTRKGGAAMKETLARGLVDLSCWQEDRWLVDLFCGSGTILIEAARKARRMDPGLDRSFVSMDWPWMGRKIYTDLRRERLSRIINQGELELKGFDIDPGIIPLARQNATQAGVGDDIQFVCKDMREVYLPENFGLIITDPPYGKRLGSEEEADQLMRELADRLLRLPSWSSFVLSPDQHFEEWMGRPADRRRKLFNGGIETNYYQYLGPNPDKFRR